MKRIIIASLIFILGCNRPTAKIYSSIPATIIDIAPDQPDGTCWLAVETDSSLNYFFQYPSKVITQVQRVNNCKNFRLGDRVMVDLIEQTTYQLKTITKVQN